MDSNSDDDDDDDVLQSTFEAARRNFAPPSRGLEGEPLLRDIPTW